MSNDWNYDWNYDNEDWNSDWNGSWTPAPPSSSSTPPYSPPRPPAFNAGSHGGGNYNAPASFPFNVDAAPFRVDGALAGRVRDESASSSSQRPQFSSAMLPRSRGAPWTWTAPVGTAANPWTPPRHRIRGTTAGSVVPTAGAVPTVGDDRAAGAPALPPSRPRSLSPRIWRHIGYAGSSHVPFASVGGIAGVFERERHAAGITGEQVGREGGQVETGGRWEGEVGRGGGEECGGGVGRSEEGVRGSAGEEGGEGKRLGGVRRSVGREEKRDGGGIGGGPGQEFLQARDAAASN